MALIITHRFNKVYMMLPAGIKQKTAGTVINGRAAFLNSRKHNHTSPACFWDADAVTGCLRRMSIKVLVCHTHPHPKNEKLLGFCFCSETQQITSSGHHYVLGTVRGKLLWPWHRHVYLGTSEKCWKLNNNSFDELVQKVRGHLSLFLSLRKLERADCKLIKVCSIKHTNVEWNLQNWVVAVTDYYTVQYLLYI